MEKKVIKKKEGKVKEELKEKKEEKKEIKKDTKEVKKVETQDEEEKILKNWANLETKKSGDNFLSVSSKEDKSSLENTVGDSPIVTEKKEDTKYAFIRDYNNQRDSTYSSSNQVMYVKNFNPNVELTRPRRETIGTDVGIRNQTGEFFGVENKKDYEIMRAERLDINQRKTGFEMEQERFGEAKFQKDYDEGQNSW